MANKNFIVHNGLIVGSANIDAATGNANVGNLFATAVYTDNYKFANGVAFSVDTSQILNGNSNVKVAANSNVTVSVAGNANVVTVTGTGANIAGTANVTGNLYVGNILTDGYYFANGSAFSVDTTQIVNGNSNVKVAANSNVTVSVAGTANVVTVTATGANITGTANVTGNIYAGNISTTGAAGNIDGANVIFANTFTSNVTTGTAPFTVSSTTRVTNLNVATAGNLISGTSNVIVTSGGNITVGSAGNAAILTVTGVGANVSGTLGVTGNITGNYILGNGSQLTGIITSVSNVVNGTSNINIASSGSNVTVGVAGNANVLVISGSGANVSGTANITGNILAGANVVYTGNLYQGATLRYAHAYTASTAAPSGSTLGDYWYDTATDILYLRVSDGVTPLWFDVSSQANTFSDTTTTNATITTASITTANVSGNINAANLQNGNSNVRIVANGNVTVSATGTANVVVVTSTGANIAGTANITGNTAIGGNLTVTGNINSVNNNRTYGLPNTGAAASYVKLGTFTASQAGQHCFIKVVASTGYNALTAQQLEVNIHFLTSNGASLDANGFAGWTSYYVTNSANTGIIVKVVGNAAGISATAYDIWVYLPTYTGNGPFYTVELSNSSTTWTNVATTGSDPGVASSTVQIGVNTFYLASNILPSANATYNLGATAARWGNIWGLASSAQYADLAERYASDSDYDPGTVVIFGGNAEITVTNTDHDPRIAGVISTAPGYLMNDHADQDALMLPVALTGRVPTRVRGPIRKGDMVVSSTEPGVGIRMKKALYEPGCVIGKSLENIDDNSIHTIEVVVGRL